jgi:hypothetical protein
MVNGVPLVDDISSLPESILEKILKVAGPEELLELENRADYPLQTNMLWKKHCLFHFPGRQFKLTEGQVFRFSFNFAFLTWQMWRDVYFCLTRENEQKVKNITLKMGVAVNEIIRQKDLKQTK